MELRPAVVKDWMKVIPQAVLVEEWERSSLFTQVAKDGGNPSLPRCMIQLWFKHIYKLQISWPLRNLGQDSGLSFCNWLGQYT